MISNTKQDFMFLSQTQNERILYYSFFFRKMLYIICFNDEVNSRNSFLLRSISFSSSSIRRTLHFKAEGKTPPERGKAREEVRSLVRESALGSSDIRFIQTSNQNARESFRSWLRFYMSYLTTNYCARQYIGL